MARFIKRVVEGGKHLMLAHIRGDVGIPFCQSPDRFDHRLRLNVFALRVIFQALTPTPLLNLLPPVANIIQRLRGRLLRQQIQHLFQHLQRIADNRHIGRHRFGNRGRVDINVQHRRIRTVFRQIVGGAIVKAHADGKNHIGIVHGHIGFIGAMHTQHTQRLTMRGRKSTQPHQR
ncbi:hypothetical protein D3C72_1307390 [compost metagenome]